VLDRDESDSFGYAPRIVAIPSSHAPFVVTRSHPSSPVVSLSRLCKPEVAGSIPARSTGKSLLGGDVGPLPCSVLTSLSTPLCAPTCKRQKAAPIKVLRLPASLPFPQFSSTSRDELVRVLERTIGPGRPVSAT
jgi:hypothetical protein